MAGSKHFRDVEKWLAKCGYEYDHQNAKSQWVYVNDSGAEMAVNPGANEILARRLIKDLQKMAGEYKAKPKRNPAQVREQQRRDREQLIASAARLDAERADILRRRDASLGGYGAQLSAAEIRAIAERIEQIENEQRAIRALMGAPVTGPNSGIRRAQHQSGSHP